MLFLTITLGCLLIFLLFICVSRVRLIMIALAATLSHLNFPWMSFLIALNIQHNGVLLRVHQCSGTLQHLVNMHGDLRTWNLTSSKRLTFELYFVIWQHLLVYCTKQHCTGLL